MAVSMTGYGRGKAESSSYSINVEIKTVNHRFCEFSIRMPRQLMKIEDKLRKTLNQHVRRGRVEVYVNFDGEGIITRKPQVDWTLLTDYYGAIKRIKDKFEVEGNITLQDLLQRTELIHIEECETANEELENLVLKAAEAAVIQVKEMRIAEGEELKKDLLSIINQLDIHVESLKQLAPLVVESFKERLTKRIQEFINGQTDEARILTEVAVFAEKADINEEMTRLKSHIQQFVQTLDDREPIGRKLDFLVQEMNREVNTIGSKANDSSISQKVVEMKSLLEKIKEQVQNLE